MVILECGTHTMRSNRHQKTLGPSLQEADKLWLLWPKQNRNNNILQNISVPLSLCDSVDEIVQEVIKVTQTSDHIVIMSNRGFDNIHKKLAQALAA